MTKLVTYTIELGETDIFTASILIVYGTGSRNEFFYNDGGRSLTFELGASSLANVHFNAML